MPLCGVFDDLCIPHPDLYRSDYIQCIRSNFVAKFLRKLTLRFLRISLLSLLCATRFYSKSLLSFCFAFLQDERSRSRFFPVHLTCWKSSVCLWCNLYISISFCAQFFFFQPILSPFTINIGPWLPLRKYKIVYNRMLTAFEDINVIHLYLLPDIQYTAENLLVN